MKIEKLNENKIRITLNNQDLAEKNIDFHSFMSNSKESQNLFLDMLDEAEKKFGFITKNYKIRIEAIALTDGNFILTITRFSNNAENTIKKSHSKHKYLNLDVNQLIYRFDSFEDFCNFSNSITTLGDFSNIAKSVILYFYKNSYYLCFYYMNINHSKLKNLYSLIAEFATYVDNSDLLSKKLNECGKIIMKNNAIKTCNKYFSLKK